MELTVRALLMKSESDSRLQIEALSWNRYATPGFQIVPSLMGKRHSFEHANHQVNIILPTEDLDEIIRTEPLMRPEGSKLWLSSSREEQGEKIPISLGLESVDVTIELKSKIKIHEQMLERPPNASDLLSKEEATRLDNVTEEQRTIADAAFERWLRVMRWHTRTSALGRLHGRAHTVNWGTDLLEKSTGKRLWVWHSPFKVYLGHPIEVDAWNRAEESLRRGDRSPLHFDYYFDGIEFLKTDEYQRSAVDFAVAAEVFLRSKIVAKLPANLLQSIATYVDDANIRTVLTKFFPELLTTQGKASYKKLSSELHKLFDARNDILHSGIRSGLNQQIVQSFRAATESLIALDDDTGNWA